jgi:GT2 family glycosyltransferase
VLDQIPDAGCVGGRVSTAGKGYLQHAIALALTSPFGVGNARYRYADKPQYLETIAYGAYRRVVFEEVGRFREDLPRNGDWEFNYRVGLAGYRLFFSPEIRSTYFPRSSFGKLWRQQYWTSLDKVEVIRRHPESFLWRHLIPSLFVVGLVGGLLLGLLFRPALYLWLLMLCVYGGVSLLASITLCQTNGWRYLPILPIIFLWIHLSYGIGLLVGVLGSLTAKRRSLEPI